MSKRKEKRGRPSLNSEVKKKFKIVSKDYDGEKITYNFNRDISENGPHSVEIESKVPYPKVKVNPKQRYIGGAPVVMVWKHKRKNAKPKMKIWKTKNIDDILVNEQAGIPENAVILELGVGNKFIDIYKEQYNL